MALIHPARRCPAARTLGACALLAALGASSCNPPRCPPVRVTLPATESVLSWLEPSRPLVPVRMGGNSETALLDTGFPHSAAALGANTQPMGDLELGGASTATISWEPLFAPPQGVDLIAGADILFQLPMVMDGRASATRIEPEF